nr:hypothetical protein CFP56_52059 [Quercus suber]
MVFSHDTANLIMVKQAETWDDIEVEGIGPRGSLNMQEVEVDCDVTLQTNPALVRKTTGGVGFSDKELSRLDFDTQLQEIDKEIAIFDSSEGGSKEGEERANTNMGGQPTRSGIVEGSDESLVKQQDILKEGKRHTKSGYTRSTIRNQAKGKGGLSFCSPQEGKRVTSLKRSFQDLEGEGKEADWVIFKGWTEQDLEEDMEDQNSESDSAFHLESCS